MGLLKGEEIILTEGDIIEKYFRFIELFMQSDKVSKNIYSYIYKDDENGNTCRTGRRTI